MAVKIRCRTCGTRLKAPTFAAARAVARRDGWTRRNGHDYCPCGKTGAAADRDSAGKALAAAAPTTEEN